MRIVCLYTTWVIKTYRHKGLKKFAETGSRAGIRPEHVQRSRNLLTALDAALEPEDMNAPGYNLHPLHGSLENHWSVGVSGNWRVHVRFV